MNDEKKYKAFEQDLKAFVNSWSMENGSNTPDYVLSEYLVGCLRAFDMAINRRDSHMKKDVP